MQKTIMLLVVVSVLHIFAMEKENRWDVTLHGTKISLIQDEVLRYYADESKKKDIIICVGECKQIEPAHSVTNRPIGECYGHDRPYKEVWFIPKRDSVHYEKYPCKEFQWRKNIAFLWIREPLVFCHTKILKYQVSLDKCYEGDEAIEKSYEDLAKCYNIALDVGIKLFKNIKNIALPMLGADFKYDKFYVSKEDTAPIAVKSVAAFLKNKPGFYNYVEFFVEDGFVFRLYKKILMEECGLAEKICLLFCGYNEDSQCILTLLPHELIDYIAKLV